MRTETIVKGVRVTHRSELSFDELVRRFRRRMGHTTPAQVAEASRDARSEIEFEARMRGVLGASGFTILAEFDHGAWARPLGLKRGLIRWVFGNPLIALSLLKLDPSTGLFAPVELLLAEHANDCSVSYMRPSSVILGAQPSVELARITRDLDAKIEALIASALEET